MPHPLDAATNAATAFPTWAEMLAELRRGWVPTLYGRTRRVRLLIRAIRAHGFRTWPESSR